MSKEKICIVDNDADHLSWLTREFSNDFQVTGFSDGEDLLGFIRNDLSNETKAAVIDLFLEQRYSGAALCREVKKIKPYLPIFAITGITDTEFVSNAILKNGFDLCIPKASVGPKINQYISSIKELIRRNDEHPDMVSYWQRICGMTANKFIVQRELVRELDYRLRKAFFYLLLPESHPLLDSLLLDEQTSCGESIVQSATAVELILNYEDGEWRNKIVKKARGKIKKSHILPSTVETKLERIVADSLTQEASKSDIVNLFRARNDCAHADTRARSYDKEQALTGLGIALDFIEYYLDCKKNEKFPE